MNQLLQTLLARKADLFNATVEHLVISLSALLCAILIAIPLAIWFSERRKQAEIILQLTNILQTIPSLAMLGLLIPFVGIGTPPALIALTLYALLPIFQNTLLGLSEINSAIKEAADAFGLSRWQRLTRIELPMALPAIISGIRTAAVLIIGTATLAALVGAGGLGNIILLGIDRHNATLTFIGASASALLAVAVSGLLYSLQYRKAYRLAVLLIALAAIGSGIHWWQNRSDSRPIVIAGKLGSEPDILINMYKLLIEAENPESHVELKPNFGKTSFLFNALDSGEIDIYPEFTGTVLESLVTLPPADKQRIFSPADTYALAEKLLSQQHNMRLLKPMQYQNTYALTVSKKYAEQHKLRTLSDLKTINNQIRAGFTLEFIDREDGYKGLSEIHHIPLKHLISIEPALRYTALSDQRVDMVDAYSTDAEIRQYQLVMLQDDLKLFRPYQGAPLMKTTFADKHPEIVGALEKLAGKITESEMSDMNYRVKNSGQTPAQVAADYLRTHHLITKTTP